MKRNRIVIYLCVFLIVVCMAGLLFTNFNHKNEEVQNEELVMEESSSIEVDNNQSIISILYAGSLTIDKLITLTDTQQLQNMMVQDFMKYSNVILDEETSSGTLTGHLEFDLEYNDEKYNLQIYYWHPDIAQAYERQPYEIDSILLTRQVTGNTILLFSTDKNNSILDTNIQGLME